MAENRYGRHFPVMEDMTVKQVRAYLAEKPSIIIPVGVIEQHGYHLPLKTDALFARHFSRLIGARCGILAAPVMYESFSGGGLPGTINISPAVMSLVMSDLLLSLADQGFRRFYILLCHGGSENDRALLDALKMLLRLNPAFRQALIALVPMWKFDRDGVGWSKAFREGDWHGGWIETSLVAALEPDLVEWDEMAVDDEPWRGLQIEHPDNYQQAEKIVDDPLVVPRLTQRPEIKVGVMGYPERGRRELGERIVQDIVAGCSAKILELEAGYDGVYKKVPWTPEPIIL